MKQIGIIYKFTIIAKYKFDGHKPFYVGQHFGLEDFDLYSGSGSIWKDFINKLKQDHLKNWKRFIRREVLYQRPCSQLVLNKIEEYFIKHEKSHYSYKLGGCNVLWGAAIENNPAKDEFVKNKMRINKKKLFSSEKGKITRKKMSDSHYNCSKDKNPTFNTKWITNGTNSKRIKLGLKIPDGWYYGNSNVIGKKNPMYGKIGKLHPNYGKKRTSEQIAKISGKNNPMFGKTSSFKGKHHTEDTKKKMSQRMSGKNNPMYGVTSLNKGKKMSEESKIKMSKKYVWK